MLFINLILLLIFSVGRKKEYYKMLELKFTEKEMKELIAQKDALYLNRDDILVLIYQNIYKKIGDAYYNIQQQIRIKEEAEEKNKA
jgi:hypothetical protein